MTYEWWMLPAVVGVLGLILAQWICHAPTPPAPGDTDPFFDLVVHVVCVMPGVIFWLVLYVGQPP